MKIKQLLFVLLTIMLTHLPAIAQINWTEDNLGYYILSEEDATVSVNWCSDDISGDLIIPSSVTFNDKTYTVTEIGGLAFYEHRGLTSVTIPESVIKIGENAFYSCSGMTSIIIGNGVTEIGSSAFYNCSSLTSIDIPDSVTSIGENVFMCCSSLTSLIIGKGVTSISYGAFDDCSGLTSVTIGNSVTKIGKYAFSGCSSLTLIDIPQSVTEISDLAFASCSGLTALKIPDSVTKIGGIAFIGCTRLGVIISECRIPPSMPDNEEIKNCVLYVPSGRKNTYSKASGWRNLSFIFDGIPEEPYIIDSGIFYAPCSGTEAIAEPFDKNLKDVEIKANITLNGKEFPVTKLEFRECKSLTSINIPDSFTFINSLAFSNCSNLTYVKFPESVTEIGYSAFSGCSSLASIDIPYGITKIHNDAFSDCSSLTTINIPESVSIIGERAFSGCTSLAEIKSRNQIPPAHINLNVFSNETYKTAILIVPEKSISSYQNDAVWGCFYNIEGADFTVPAESLTVASESATTLKDGETVQLIATIAPKNTTDKTVVWSTSDADIATVDENGLVTAHAKLGIAIIGAACGAISDSLKITVAATPAESIIVAAEGLTRVKDGETIQLIAIVAPATVTDKTIVWSTSDADIATVDENGLVTAHAKLGTAVITATCGEVYGSLEVTVAATPAESVVVAAEGATTLKDGETVQLNATVAPENATDKTVVWYASDDAIATVDPNGLVTAHAKLGTAVIAAICGSVYGTIEVTVAATPAESVVVAAEGATILKDDETVQLTATVAPKNTTDKTVVWLTSDAEIASVDEMGLVTAHAKAGIVTITATCGGASGSIEITVEEESGIDSILANSDIRIKVFGLGGSVIYDGIASEFSRDTLVPGMYIISISAGESRKLIIR